MSARVLGFCRSYWEFGVRVCGGEPWPDATWALGPAALGAGHGLEYRAIDRDRRAG